jgi:D-lyxose ketol-isomerase
MKRSFVNSRIRDAEAFLKECRFELPAFARWTPDDWKTKGREADEIRACSLGWDLTDFGSGDFDKVGLLLVTIRNGLPNDPASKQYCEKAMISGEGQVTPWHFHWSKTEDIINRAGGKFVIELAMATEDEKSLSDEEVVVSCDGVEKRLPARSRIVLSPGESITLTPRLYHTFYAEKGTGRVLVGEVSSVNDDREDNRFLEPAGRFPEIEDDEPAYRYLCTGYPPAG